MSEKMTKASGNWPEEQKKEYIRTAHDNLFVEAGAGAGKTTLLTRRIVNLIKAGLRPEGFVLITYTQEAAGKLKERIVRCLKEEQILAASDVYQSSNPDAGDRERVLGEIERAVKMADSMLVPKATMSTPSLSSAWASMATRTRKRAQKREARRFMKQKLPLQGETEERPGICRALPRKTERAPGADERPGLRICLGKGTGQRCQTPVGAAYGRAVGLPAPGSSSPCAFPPLRGSDV